MKKTKRQKTELGYKVVRVRDRRNYSCTGRFTKKRCVRYPSNTWAHPFNHCGPLAVFDTLSSAKSFLKTFIQGNTTYKIYLCKYVPSKGDYLFIGRIIYPTNKRLEYLPYGTKLARSVKIVKKCYEKKAKKSK